MLTLVSKALSFLREMILAATFGAGKVLDAFDMAYNLTMLLVLFIPAYLANTFVPIYQGIKKKKGHNQATRFANNVLHLLIILSCALCVLCIVFPQMFVHIVAPSFKGQQLSLTIRMFRIICIYIPLTAMVQLLTNILSANHLFTGGQLIHFPLSIITIILCLIWGASNPIFLAYAVVASVITQNIILFFYCKRTEYRYEPYFSLTDENIRKSFALFLPIIVASCSLQINIMVDSMLASGLPEGSVAALGFAQKLLNLCVALLSLPLVTVAFPQFAEYATVKDWDSMRASINNCMQLSMFVLIPVTIIAVICSTDIVRLVYERGMFDQVATSKTGYALLFYMASLPFIGISNILSKVFFSLQDTKGTAIAGIVSVVTNIASSIILIRYMGIGGLALGTSIGNMISACTMLVLLRRKHSDLGCRYDVAEYVRMAGCALICGGTVLLCNRLLSDTSLYIRLPVCSVIGAGVYLFAAYFLSVKIAKQAKTILMGKLKLKMI